MAEKIFVDKEKGLYKYADIPEMMIRDIFYMSNINLRNELVIVSLTEYIDQARVIQFNACTRVGNQETQSIFRKTRKAGFNAYQKLAEAEFC